MTDIKLPGKQSSIIWHAADFAIKLGATRLIAFPLIAQTLSPESFGTFVTAMSVALVLGGALTTAYSNFIIKTLGEVDEVTRTKTSLYLSIKSIGSTTALFLTTSLLLWCLPVSFTIGEFWLWLAVFAFHYIMSVQAETLLTTLRVSRKFKTLAGAHFLGVLAMLLVLLIPGLSEHFAVILSILTWSAVPMATSLYLYRASLFSVKNEKLPKQSKAQISHFFIGGIATFLTEYIDRILLAAWWPAETVSTFFAAASLAMLMSAPGLIVSTYLLSMLAKIPFTKIRSPKYFLGYFVFVTGVCCSIYLAGLLTGDFLLNMLYPNQYNDAAPIFQTCLLAAALLTCSTLLKPIVTRYHLSVVTPVISFTTLAIRLLIAYILIKNGGLLGASHALVYGAAITSIAWMIPYFSLMGGRLFHPHTDGQ